MAVRPPPPGRRPPPPPNPDDGSAPRRGRPTKLTEDLLASAVAMLLAGNYECAAAAALGVTSRTWKKWKRLGRQYPDGLYGRFLHSVDRAVGLWHVQAVTALTTSADPRVIFAMLERKFPQQWGRYTGELGELKRRVAELEELLAREAAPAKAD